MKRLLCVVHTSDSSSAIFSTGTLSAANKTNLFLMNSCHTEAHLDLLYNQLESHKPYAHVTPSYKSQIIVLTGGVDEIQIC